MRRRAASGTLRRGLLDSHRTFAGLLETVCAGANPRDTEHGEGACFRKRRSAQTGSARCVRGVTSVNGAAPVAAPIPSGKANINHLEVSMLTKTIIIEVSAESEEALN